MRINPRALFGGPVPWTCAQCANKTPPSAFKRAFGGAREVKVIHKKKPVRAVYLAAAGVAGAGAGAVMRLQSGRGGWSAVCPLI
jgi:hypothetical protein